MVVIAPIDWTVTAEGQVVAPPQLIIEAPDELRAIAERVAPVDESAIRELARLIGTVGPVRPIRVVVVGENSALGQSTPRWIAGFANSAARTIVIFPARSPSYPHDSLRDVLIHEIAHVMITDAAGGAPVPRWFHEGLALAAERAWGLEDRTRLMLAVTLERRSFARLNEGFGGTEQQAARAYALAGAIVRDLLQDHDATVGARILARLAAGDSFERAFQMVTGRTLLEAERSFWRESWWYQIVPFLTSSVVLWTAMIFLAVYARRARRQRRADLHRKWEEEEHDDSFPSAESDETQS